EIRHSRRRRRVGLVGDPAAVAVRAARGSPDAGPEHRIALRVAVLVVNLDKRVVARSDAVPVVVEVGLDGLAVAAAGIDAAGPGAIPPGAPEDQVHLRIVLHWPAVVLHISAT